MSHATSADVAAGLCPRLRLPWPCEAQLCRGTPVTTVGQTPQPTSSWALSSPSPATVRAVGPPPSQVEQESPPMARGVLVSHMQSRGEVQPRENGLRLGPGRAVRPSLLLRKGVTCDRQLSLQQTLTKCPLYPKSLKIETPGSSPLNRPWELKRGLLENQE